MKHSYYNRFKRRLCSTLIPLGLAITTFGCAASHKEPAVSPTQAASQISTQRELAYHPNTVRLIAKVDYNDGKAHKRVVGRDFIISAQAPDRMRVTISAFDKAMETLVTNGSTFALLDAVNDQFVTGKATPENLSKILPLYLSAHDLFRILTAQFPDEAILPNQSPEYVWNTRVGAYELIYDLTDDRQMHVFYSYPQGDLVKMTIVSGDESLYEFEAEDFSSHEPSEEDDEDLDEDIRAAAGPRPSIRLPETIIFRMKPQETDVRLRIESYALDVDFVPQVFDLMPPAGTKTILLKDDTAIQFQAPDLSDVSAQSNVSTQDVTE